MKTAFLISIILLSSCSAKTLSIKDQQKKEIKKVKAKKTKQEVKRELRILGIVAIIGFFIGYEIGNNYK
jgi:phosphate/sulfate permease